MDHDDKPQAEPIALIGMGCRFPGGANSPEAFWKLLRAGVDAVCPIPESRWDVAKFFDPNRNAPGKMYVREGGFLRDEEFTGFDCGFFGIAPREAASLDPQQRLLLEVSWEALENAGQGPRQVDGSRTGVFVGTFWDDYSAERFYLPPVSEIDAFSTLAGVRSMTAGRIAFFLNLRGPSIQLDAACASSLLAVHVACQSLRQNECDMALAGGVSLILSPRLLVGNSRMNALATSGRCEAFAAGTDGFGRGEGCGIVVLKRYADAVRDGDTILACIRGSAVNSDGRSLSLTTPNVAAQKTMLDAALANAGVLPDQIQYLEAHGTGTPLGDPIELAAIGQVFGPTRDTPLLVGSVKTNIAHLDAAAGVSGLIKVVLSMQHGEIPASLHFSRPNPFINWSRLPVTIATKLTPWPEGRKLAGISAFGLSGTNVHVVAEEGPAVPLQDSAGERPWNLLTLSARDETALQSLVERYSAHLSGECPELGDICYTAAVGRTHFRHRVALLANSTDQLREQVGALLDGSRSGGTRLDGLIRLRRGQEPGKPRIAFLFTGQGAQYINMGKQLYDTLPVFRRVIDRCEELLRPYLEEPLTSALYPVADSGKLSDTVYAQPALFAVECALAAVWRSWGIEPDVVLGHSTGEYAAACVAGVMGLEDGIRLVAARARLIESVAGNGATAAVLAGAEPVRAALGPWEGRVSVAGMNGPFETLIAGDASALEEVIASLSAAGLECRRLDIPHAPHSPQMDSILDEFEALAATVTYSAPRCRFVSNVTGGSVDSVDAHYWRRHLREPVRFAEGVAQLVTEGCNVMLEAGPQPVLQLLARQNWRGPKGAAWLSSLWSAQEDWAQLLRSAGELYVRGANLDWTRFEREAGSVGVRRKVSLPTYPFQRERQWTDAPVAAAAESDETLHPLLGRRIDSVVLEPGQVLFHSALSALAPAYLKDHRANGRVLLPGAAFLEMALALGRGQLPSEQVVVEHVSFERALFLGDGGSRQVQCLATPGRDGLSWQVFSSADPASDTSDGWTKHADGLVRAGSSRSRVEAEPLAILQQRVREAVEPATLYERFEQVHLQYGPEFRLIRRLWRADAGASVLGEVRLPNSASAIPDRYVIHPALLDACLQVSALLFLNEGRESTGDSVYLPTGLDRLTWLLPASRKAPGELWCAARLRSSESEHLTIDLVFYGKDGAVAGTLDGLHVRKIPASALAAAADWRDWLYHVSWQLQELPKLPLPEDRSGDHWLVVAGTGGLGAEVAERLHSTGARVTLVPATNSVADYSAVLDSIPSVTGLLYDGNREGVTSVHNCTGLLHLIQALAAIGSVPRLYLVTRGAVAGGPVQALPGLTQSALWGMAKVIGLEYPETSPVVIDLDPADLEGSAPMLASELTSEAGTDEQVAYRGGMRYVARLARHKIKTPSENHRWEVADRGRLETLRPVPVPRRDPAPGEIEVELHAAGLNFRDVLTALDLYPGNVGHMGLEGAGCLVACGSESGFAVGDRVMVIAPGCFSRYLTVDAKLAVRIPDGLNDADAATIPSVFVTAWHCLQHLAGIRVGERVLIHTAAGGIGHAAIQIAQLAGAEIHATASPSKWPALRAMGIRHIYNSRTSGFGNAILADTDGRGVDIVLNTLTSPGFIAESLGALAPGGRFLEISKRDVFSPAEMTALRSDVRYYLVDQAELLVREPDLVQSQLRLLVDLFTTGRLKPLPQTTFAMRDMVAAFRTMEKALHVGKVVLTHPKPGPVGLDPSATYLITGGAGGLGLVVARGLAERGARRLLLVSRRSPLPDAQRKIDEIRSLGVEVLAAQADVADADAMSRLFAEIPSSFPLKGVIHAAGSLDDAVLANQNTERFSRVMGPKVDGAWNLHRLTLELPLDFFVLFSSASSMLGMAGQANYAAANAFLDSLAFHRQALGLPALAINWGVWADVGSAAQFVPQLARMGLNAIRPEQGAEIVAALLGEPEPQVGVIPVDWSRFDSRRAFYSGFRRRQSLLRQETESLLPELQGKNNGEKRSRLALFVQTQIASILRYASASQIPLKQGFRELGLDSLTSMELRNRLESALECRLPAAVIYNQPNAEALAGWLVAHLSGGKPALETEDVKPEAGPSTEMRERFVTVSGLPVCVCEWGPEDGRLVVCVHGSRDQGLSWEDVAAPLAAAGCRVVAPDLRGHGRSGHGEPSSPYHLRDFVGDLAQLVDWLGAGPVLLVGHSLGAIIATLYAAVSPERVERLILVEPPLSPLADDAQSFMDQMAIHVKATEEVRTHEVLPDLQSAADRLRVLTPRLSEEEALRRARRLTETKDGGIVWRWDIRFDGQSQLEALFSGLKTSEFLSMLAGMRVPLTVVYGGDSGWISPADKTRIQSALPDLEPIVLPGGHNVHLDAPLALAEAIRQAGGITTGVPECQ